MNTVYEVEVRALYGEMQSVWVRVPGEVRTATPPPARIHNVRVVGGPGSDDGVWRTEERVVVEVRYDEPVVVERPDCWTYNADGTCRPSGPYMVVAFRSDARPGYGEVQGVAQARYVRGSGTATLRFAYTVSAAEDGARGAWAADGGLLLRGATIRTLEGGEGKSRYTNTRVMQVTVDRSGRAWTAGEKVRVKVRFSGPVPYTPPDEPENRDKVVVDETEGTPTIDLLLGDREDREQTRRASYERGSGTNTLVFEYEVTAGDGRVGAVEVVADTLASNGATIRNRRGYDAELGHLGAVQYAPRSLTTGKPTNRVTVSVADTRVRESPGATLDFAVTLSGSASDPVTVDYRTVDGSARAGSDYTAASSTLTFAPGETAKTVSVPVLDDAHDEGEEKMGLVLYRASGAVRDDYVAIGTIENSDPLQQAWLARFGRTVATHVTDAVGARLRGTPGQESHLTVGGSRLPVETLFGGADATAPVAAEPEVFSLRQWLRGAGPGPGPAAGERAPAWLQGVAGVLGLGPGPRTGPWTEPPGGNSDPRLGQSRTLDLTLRQVLLGSSFRLTLGADDAQASRPRLTAWGRVAGTTFDGRDGKVSLNGDVLTGTVGVDGEWDRLLAGLAVAHSRGDGSFTMPGTDDRGRGDLENTLTSIHPYLRYAVNDRLAVWGLFGYGWGEWDLEMDNGMTIETDTNLVMGAFGGRGLLLSAAESGGFQLATRTDAMLTRTTSDKVAEMESAEADAHRLRLVLEGSRGFTWAEGRRLTPTMEVGLRHDWGDAETGFGLELGGRVQYADPALGLTIDATVRGLLAHEDRDYQEWGASGTVRVAPGAGGHGLSLTLAPAWGATASGVNGLWSRQTTAGLAPQGTRQTPVGRLNAEVGYGFAPFDTGLLTPYAGTVLSEGAARTYRVGTRLQLGRPGATGLTLNLEGTRQEPAGQQPVNQGLRLQATWRF